MARVLFVPESSKAGNVRGADGPVNNDSRLRLAQSAIQTSASSAISWGNFIINRMYEECVRVLVFRGEDGFDTRTDWPSLCNSFRWTGAVQREARVLREALVRLSTEDATRVREEKIWVGASEEIVRLAWGSPQDINRTTTASGTREQWVYGRGTYVYVENGRVTAIQN